MQTTVYNPQKGRLETITVELTGDNTTWFDDLGDNESISMITDFENGLLISEHGYKYPIWVYDASRASIGYDRKKAKRLQQEFLR